MNAPFFVASGAENTASSGESGLVLTTSGGAHGPTCAALRFITCGSVDDGKSTLIGRLLLDSRAVLADQLAGVSRSGTADLALLTDGLTAEREQGITIDVAWRYFATPARKFIIGDAPGHEQYTRNMVTAASNADVAVLLVDATKLAWALAGGAQVPADEGHGLLPQTRRHALLAHLLRVPSLVFAVNKLDAVPQPEAVFDRIRRAIAAFADDAGLDVHAVLPISALRGDNVVQPNPGWCGWQGPSLIALLESLPSYTPPVGQSFGLAVQWVEKGGPLAPADAGRRVYWGRVASGRVQVGQEVVVLHGAGLGPSARVAQVLDAVRTPRTVAAGDSAGVVLDRELDVSRGDWLLAPGTLQPQRSCTATVAWMDEEPLAPGRSYWALHGHRWVRARVQHVAHRLDIHSLARQDAQQLAANDIGRVTLAFQEPLALRPYADSRAMGALVLVDTASHKTAAAVLVD